MSLLRNLRALALVALLPAAAVSAVKPTIPAQDSPLESARLPQNFRAIADNIYRLDNTFAGTTSPANGAGLFRAQEAAAPFRQPAVAPLAGMMQADWVDPHDYLPLSQPDGVTDNSAGFVAINAALCSRATPGAEVHLAAATWIIRDVTFTCSGIHILGAAASNLGHGTVINYSGASDHGIRFQPAGFPAITSAHWLYGDGIEDVTFYSSAGSTRALDLDGFYGCFVRRVDFSGSLYNGIRLYGGYRCDIEDVSDSGYIGGIFTNYFIELAGDLSGKASGGDVCALSSCSTRIDLVSLRNIDVYATSGIGIYIHGIVDTTAGEHISLNAGTNGLVLSCPVGFPNVTYCPYFTTFTDLQTEGATDTSISLTDSTDFQCFGCYAYGGGTANNVLYAALANYSQTLSAGSGVRWIGGRIANAQHECVYMAISDTKISDAFIYQCNRASKSYNSTQYAGGTQHSESTNTYCTLAGTAYSAGGVLVAPAALKVALTGNTYYGCSSGLTNSSSLPTTVGEVNALGP